MNWLLITDFLESCFAQEIRHSDSYLASSLLKAIGDILVVISPLHLSLGKRPKVTVAMVPWPVYVPTMLSYVRSLRFSIRRNIEARLQLHVRNHTARN